LAGALVECTSAVVFVVLYDRSKCVVVCVSIRVLIFCSVVKMSLGGLFVLCRLARAMSLATLCLVHESFVTSALFVLIIGPNFFCECALIFMWLTLDFQ
jgi:hypothetical protein